MLRMLWDQGVRSVVATPHFYGNHDQPERFLRKREAAAEKLMSALNELPQMPRVYLGAEVYYFQGMSDSDALRALTIGGSSYLLVEMPMGKWNDRMYQELVQIREKLDLIPVVAHVDRYLSPLATHGIPKRLEELPVLVQANAGFFLRSGTKRMSVQMLKKGQIHLLGSDCHNTTSRPPRIGAAVERIRKELGQEALEMICSYQSQILGECI
jgi:protein-tyrosine phosphatase